MEVTPRSIERGKETKHHARDHRDYEPEYQHAKVGVRVEQARQRTRVDRQQRARRHQCERGAERTAEYGQQH